MQQPVLQLRARSDMRRSRGSRERARFRSSAFLTEGSRASSVRTIVARFVDDVTRAMQHIGFTAPFNIGEQPAISVLCGHDRNGVPIGLQIAGHRFDDLGVLRAARAWERIAPPARPWPVVTG